MIAADVTLPGDVARLAGEHDAVIAAVYDGGADPADFFVNAARALSEGAGKARLVWVGLASIVEAEPGVLLMDHDHPVRTGGYQVVQADSASRISYADLAIALLDEIDDPRHHRTRIGVARTRST